MSKEISYRFIVVEGPIGVGKTSLARRLADDFSAELILEQAESNPFLERFYRDPVGAALPTQLHFLFQRTQQLSALRQADMFASLRVADYLLEKDRLFARVTLDDAEYALYEQVYARMVIDPPKPDLVIYMQAPVNFLLGRLARNRGNSASLIEHAYLEKLNEGYARFFHDYDSTPLLIINAATLDPVSSDIDFIELKLAMQNVGRGRLYFKPLRHAVL